MRFPGGRGGEAPAELQDQEFGSAGAARPNFKTSSQFFGFSIAISYGGNNHG